MLPPLVVGDFVDIANIDDDDDVNDAILWSVVVAAVDWNRWWGFNGKSNKFLIFVVVDVGPKWW